MVAANNTHLNLRPDVLRICQIKKRDSQQGEDKTRGEFSVSTDAACRWELVVRKINYFLMYSNSLQSVWHCLHH